MGTADPMKDAGCWTEAAAEAGQPDAESDIDVVQVGAEMLWEAANLPQHFRAIEGRRRTGAEHLGRLIEGRQVRSPLASLLGPSVPVIPVPRAIDAVAKW